MMGSGTVLAVARAQGHQALGVDLDPLAVLISRVWTTPVNREEATKKAKLVLSRAKTRFKSISARNAYPRGADEETKQFVRYWFDVYSRRQLSALSAAISSVRSTEIRDVLWCAFSRLIITKQAGASLAMDLSHSRPHKSFAYAPAKPFSKFLSAVERVIENSIGMNDQARGPATKIYEADARKLPIKSRSIDLVLTSPPYLNAIDYIRCSKFSLVWMGYSVSELGMVRSKSVGTEFGGSGEHTSNKDIANVIAHLNLTPKLDGRHRTILARYVHDMKAAMSEIERVLVPNGKAVFVVGENTVRGTYIRTARILTELAKLIGLKLIKRQVRILPANRRYLPPPSKRQGKMIDSRMRRELIVSFRKPKQQTRTKVRV